MKSLSRAFSVSKRPSATVWWLPRRSNPENLRSQVGTTILIVGVVAGNISAAAWVGLIALFQLSLQYYSSRDRSRNAGTFRTKTASRRALTIPWVSHWQSSRLTVNKVVPVNWASSLRESAISTCPSSCLPT